MANIFKQQQGVNNHPKRNNFDLSFQNHATFKFGKLYPVFCKEVVPGDSFRIKSAFGLKFMPMVFPVQTKMRASMHFFYVRNKNLWDRWEDWISGLKGSEDNVYPPYISNSSQKFRTGSLVDYLNIPTTISDSFGGVSVLNCPNIGYGYNNRGQFDIMPSPRVNPPAGVTYLGEFIRPVNVSLYDAPPEQLYDLLSYDEFISAGNELRPYVAYLLDGEYVYGPNSDIRFGFNSNYFDTNTLGDVDYTFVLFKKNDVGQFIFNAFYKADSGDFVINDGHLICEHIFGNVVAGTYKFVVLLKFPYDVTSASTIATPIILDSVFASTNTDSISDALISPFTDDSRDGIRISALPFRAYESIMNVFYRNSVIDPFMINGKPEYNKFITNNQGGADSSTPLDLYERNYELDFLTSALPSPQQGIAPLVGFSALGEITVSDEDGNPINAQYELSEDNTFTGKVSIHNPAASNSVKSYLSRAGMALAGLSINDFRNVNALQRWLETNIRKGYRYKDFIEGHFGKSPKYNELDMPEFIGGYSRDVQVSQIVQSADMGVIDEKAGTLGSFAGMASCYGGSKHDITHYCDDYGFIIGIMCVIPNPSYSQLLPKFFIKDNPLDYYFPEFSQLGLQPITYSEVCPLTIYNQIQSSQTHKEYSDTFGYQRPNYDLVASVDEVHGQFRTSLRDFLIQRYFNDSPELGRDFIKIKNEDCSSVFSIQSPADDNILGQIIFQVYAKRPIPRVVIPSLGR